MKRQIRLLRLAALLVAALLLAALGGVCEEGAREEEVQYVENEWNYVEGSMDVSGGIPENAGGRLGRIRASGRLTVATEPYFPPQEFLDETREGQDRFVGSDMELARLIAERMGVTLEIVPMAFSQVISEVADGKYDLAISALAFTAARSSRLELSKGYFYSEEPASSGLLIRQADVGEIRSISDLAERDIAAQSDSLQETMAVENIDFYRQFRRASSVDNVYALVRDGTVDAGIVDLESAGIYLAGHPDSGLCLVQDVTFSLQPQYQGDRIAAQKGEIQLIGFVNGVIDEVLESGQYTAWYNQFAGNQ